MKRDLRTHPRRADFEFDSLESVLTEVEFLFERRADAIHAIQADWPAVAKIERRLIAYGWVWDAYGSRAHALGLDSMEADDSGLHLPAIWLCGSAVSSKSIYAELQTTLLRAAPKQRASWEQGLRLATRRTLDVWLDTLVASAPEPAIDIAASALGFRQTLRPEAALARFESASPSARETLGVAMAKVGYLPAIAALKRALQTAPRSTPLLYALQRLGEHSILHELRTLCGQKQPPAGVFTLLARYGEARDTERLRRAPPSPDAAAAIGSIGRIDLMPRLIELLEDPDDAVQAAAADALRRVSGDNLVEKVELPAEQDEHPDDPSAPIVVERTSRDPERWQQHFDRRARDLRPHERLRQGRPYSREVVLAELKDPHARSAWRADAADDLALRGGKPHRFDVEAWVADQLNALRAFEG